MRVAGADGTKGGWVAIVLENGRFAADRLLPLDTGFAELGDVEVLAVDIPIGFGPRQADKEARAFLPGAAARVFPAPPEEVLRVPFGPGLGLPAQAHALGPRILHVTRLARSDRRIYETHPEVSFRAMNELEPLRYRKKSAGGAFERIDLLRRHGIELDRLEAAPTAPLDDVLDAAAAAWSANRIASGQAGSLPDPPERVNGREVAIWF